MLTFPITGHGLGASGFITRLAVQVGVWVAPEATAGNSYFSPFLASGAPLATWITWEAVGVLLGA